MKKSLLFLFIIISNSYATECQFEAPPTVLASGDSHLFQYWDFSTTAVIDSASLPHSETFTAYRNAVTKKISTDSSELLTRYSKTTPDINDTYNLNRVMKDYTKKIRPIHCLEALLIDTQIKRSKEMLTTPSEFVAFYLQNKQKNLRVYYFTNDTAGIRKVGKLLGVINEELQKGWVLTQNFHNHSFFLDNLNIDESHHPQGVLIPSSNDIQIFRVLRDELKMQSASISNGFNTLTIEADDLKNFHDPKGQ